MAFLFPVLYGVYLSLGLLVLQPFEDLGLSPLGGAAIFILGAGLFNFLFSLRSLPDSLYIQGHLARKIAGVSAVQVFGSGAFMAGVLNGSGYLYALIALLYGVISGTIWSRFVRVREVSVLGKIGVILASLSVVFFLVFRVQMDAPVSLSQFLTPVLESHEVMVSRSLTLVGAIFWGISQFVYHPREFLVGRGVWNFWESLFSIVFVLFFAGLIRALTLPEPVLSIGFSSEPLFIVPFLLIGFVLSALRQRLVHAWEPLLSNRFVHVLWVIGASFGAIFASVLFLQDSPRVFEIMGVCVTAVGAILLRFRHLEVSDFQGLHEVEKAENIESLLPTREGSP